MLKIIPKPVYFEWDRGNIDKNYKKHNVTAHEAEQVFGDEEKIFFEDEKHSGKELRHGLFGRTLTGRILSVVFTVREEKVRVITVRDMSKKERRDYNSIRETPQ